MFRKAAPPRDRDSNPAALLLGLSLVLGGGGSPAPLPEIALQCLVALIVAAWLLRSPFALAPVPQAAWWIAGLAAGLHLLQLVPLPPALWQALPGREGERAALELVGAGGDWRALTVSPARTLASLLALLAALACLVCASALDTAGRWRLVAVTAAIGLATLILGAAQLSGGSGSPLRLFDPESPFLNGFQANKNSTADVILAAMLAWAALARFGLERGWLRLGPASAAAAAMLGNGLLMLGLLLTGSRAGLMLLPIVLLLQLLILRPRTRWGWKRRAASLAAAAGSLALAALALRGNRMVGAVLARFGAGQEFRPELWRDSLYALGQHWPVGAGQGTFAPVMIAAERLEVVDPTLPHRAHNDYLELAMGAGLPGLLVLAAIGMLIGWAAWRALHQNKADSRPQALFAIGTLGVLALHSLVDYPLRSMALAALAACSAGMLLPARPDGRGQSVESQP